MIKQSDIDKVSTKGLKIIESVLSSVKKLNEFIDEPSMESAEELGTILDELDAETDVYKVTIQNVLKKVVDDEEDVVMSQENNGYRIE